MQRISFKPFLVDQIIAGNKTATRRIMSDQPARDFNGFDSIPHPYHRQMCIAEVHRVLWCKGNRVCVEYKDGAQRTVDVSERVIEKIDARLSRQRWLPGRFMFDEFARLNLDVLDINNEWLLDIGTDAAMNEGVEVNEKGYKNYLKKDWYFDCPVQSFFSLWDNINGINAHRENPAVFALQFDIRKI